MLQNKAFYAQHSKRARLNERPFNVSYSNFNYDIT
jgi:hypothetical protein